VNFQTVMRKCAELEAEVRREFVRELLLNVRGEFVLLVPRFEGSTQRGVAHAAIPSRRNRSRSLANAALCRNDRFRRDAFTSGCASARCSAISRITTPAGPVRLNFLP
jgi:hypothetical protein